MFLLDADGKRVRRTIGFGPPVYVRISESTPQDDISLIGETMELKEHESGAETRKRRSD